MNEPRRHHYVPESYLLNFCELKKKKKHVFYIYDNDKSQWRIGQPKNESVETDFQKISNREGIDPYIFEKEFSQLESQAIDAIRRAIKNKKLPKGLDDIAPILNLVGLLAGRNVNTRKLFTDLTEHVHLNVFKLITKDERTYHKQMHKIRGIDKQIPDYQEFKDFIDKGEFKIQMDPSPIVEELIKVSSDITDLLLERCWMLIETTTSYFITSNNPVNIIWAHGWQPFVPGYGLINTIVTFPISPNLALIGSFSPLPGYCEVNKDVVEGVNWCTACGGANVIYSKRQIPFPSILGTVHLQSFHRLLPSRLLEH